jgi:two-component system, chemotaxis family, chemotaxis protein CheY
MNEIKLPIVALVDDDQIYQFTASKTLQLTKSVSSIHSFSMAEDAINYLQEHANQPDSLPDYIFLDINMPVKDGWNFLEDFEKIFDTLVKPMTIYMVSSSIDPRDVQRAEGNRYIKEYVTKPITLDKLYQLIGKS